MKNFKNTIIVSLVATVAFASYASYAAAADIVPHLSVAPSGVSKSAGAVFNTSVSVVTNPSEIVYAAEGTLALNNLTCKGITVADGLMVQSMPTCANPYFLVGIPNGTNSEKKLFTVAVAGTTEGVATLSLNTVDVIGSGVSLSNEATGASFTITPGVTPTPDVASTTPETSQGGEVVTSEATSSVSTSTSEVATTSSPVARNTATGLLAAAGEALYGIPSAMVIVLGVILLALLVGIIVYRRSKNQN